MNKIALEGLTCFTVQLKVEKSDYSKKHKVLLLASNPLPGYYSKQNFPPNQKRMSDQHLFLLIKDSVNCFQDLILRHVQAINEKFNHNFHISPGQIQINGKENQCVRINTRNSSYIGELIGYLSGLGIEFQKDKKIEAGKNVVFYKKYIEFIELSKGVYQDASVPGRFYFSIPSGIEFDQFESKMMEIKNSCNFHLFDSFLVHLFRKDKVLDFVGIYSDHCDKNRFEELEKNLMQKFSK